jgi:cytochrome c-type biogenesis protein CcmF
MKISNILTLVGTGSVWCSLLLLLKYVFENNFTYKYVLEHSSSDLSAILKLSVLWTGQEGSFLLWTSLSFLFYVIFKKTFLKNLEERVVRRSLIAASILCLVLIITTIISNPFVLTDELSLEGRGLNPLLRTFWNVIHPPIVFLGYAAALIPASIIIGKLTCRRVKLDSFSTRKLFAFMNLQMIFVWTFLTLGIILGGFWAYATLGWGGYWAWDPVETTSLIAWLFCTAYFHSKGLLDQRGYGANSLVFFTFLSILFATFITRSGIISSVHGFSQSPEAYSVIILLIGSFFAFISLLVFQFNSSSYSLNASRMLDKIKSSRHLFGLFLSLVSILGLILICFIGVIYPIILQVVSSTQYETLPTFYNIFAFPFALGLLVSTFFCMFPNPTQTKISFVTICSAIILGITFVFLDFPTFSALANFLLPTTVLSIFYVAARVVHSFIIKNKMMIRSLSHTILHLGLVVILFGVLISNNTEISVQGWYSAPVSINLEDISVEVDDIELQFTNSSSYISSARFSVYKNGRLIGIGKAVHGFESFWGSYHQPIIVSTLLMDVYIVLHGVSLDLDLGEISHAYLEVKIIKFISLIWIGCIVTEIAVGILLVIFFVRFITDWKNKDAPRKNLINNNKSRETKMPMRPEKVRDLIPDEDTITSYEIDK